MRHYVLAIAMLFCMLTSNTPANADGVMLVKHGEPLAETGYPSHVRIIISALNVGGYTGVDIGFDTPKGRVSLGSLNTGDKYYVPLGFCVFIDENHLPLHLYTYESRPNGLRPVPCTAQLGMHEVTRVLSVLEIMPNGSIWVRFKDRIFY